MHFCHGGAKMYVIFSREMQTKDVISLGAHKVRSAVRLMILISSECHAKLEETSAEGEKNSQQ